MDIRMQIGIALISGFNPQSKWHILPSFSEDYCMDEMGVSVEKLKSPAYMAKKDFARVPIEHDVIFLKRHFLCTANIKCVFYAAEHEGTIYFALVT